MGQAKRRGTREQRIEQVVGKIEALKPEHIICNNCQAKLTEVFVMDTRGMQGIEAAFAASCKQCDRTTYAIKGDPEAIAALSYAMEESSGEAPKMGMIPAPER